MFFQIIIERWNYVDKDLAWNICQGFQTLGEAPVFGVWDLDPHY